MRPAQFTLLNACTLSLSALAIIWAAIFSGCGQSTWSDRQPAIVEGIRVDSLRFVPAHSRFVLLDSASKVLFKGYHVGYGLHAGYDCIEILDMKLESLSKSQPAAFGPKTRVRLPTGVDCPLDTAGQDSLLTYVFPAGGDSIIRLRNSSGRLTDSAMLVRGRFFQDSLKGKPSGETHVFAQGHWSFLDSTATIRRRLFVDSLGCNDFLNQGTYAIKLDTVKVRVSWVTLDSPCQGSPHTQEIVLEQATY